MPTVRVLGAPEVFTCCKCGQPSRYNDTQPTPEAAAAEDYDSERVCAECLGKPVQDRPPSANSN